MRLTQVWPPRLWTTEQQELFTHDTESSIAAARPIELQLINNPAELELLSGVSGKTAKSVFKKLKKIQAQPALTKTEALSLLTQIPRFGPKKARALLLELKWNAP